MLWISNSVTFYNSYQNVILVLVKNVIIGLESENGSRSGLREGQSGCVWKTNRVYVTQLHLSWQLVYVL